MCRGSRMFMLGAFLHQPSTRKPALDVEATACGRPLNASEHAAATFLTAATLRSVTRRRDC